MSREVKRRVAVVTGGGRGLSRRIALELTSAAARHRRLRRSSDLVNHYLNDPDCAPDRWETDIYVPVERTSRS